MIALVMYFWLPESLQFLSVKGKAKSQIARVLSRINPAQSYAAATEFFVPEQTQAGVPLLQLFQQGRARCF